VPAKPAGDATIEGRTGQRAELLSGAVFGDATGEIEPHWTAAVQAKYAGPGMHIFVDGIMPGWMVAVLGSSLRAAFPLQGSMPMEEEPNPPATFAVQSAPIAKPMYIAVLPFRVPEMYKRLGG